MARLKIWNNDSSQWEYAAYGGDGVTGATGPAGPTGPSGVNGTTGVTGATGPAWNGAQLAGITLNNPDSGVTTVANVTTSSPSTSATGSGGSFSNVYIGMAVDGLGILPQTYVANVNNGTGTVTLSKAASNSAATLPGTGPMIFHSPWWPLSSGQRWRAGILGPITGPKVICSFGDSIMQGVEISGTDPYFIRLGRMLADEMGPLVGFGFRGTWLNFANAGYAAEWSITTPGDWVRMTGTNPADVAPFSEAFYAKTGNANSHGLVWSVPTTMGLTVPGAVVRSFEIIYIDAAANGLAPGSDATGVFSYRIDGGAVTSSGITPSNNNKLQRLQVNATINSNISIVAGETPANVATAAIVGIIPYYVTNGWSAQGFIYHNLGRSGAGLEWLNNSFGTAYPFYRPLSTGDSMQILDLLQPDLSIAGWINDQNAYFNDPAGSAANWTPAQLAFFARAGGAYKSDLTAKKSSDLLWLSYYDGPNATTGFQQGFRDNTKTNTAAWGVNLVDLYDAWSAAGFTGSAGVQPLLNRPTDTIHPNQLGYDNIAITLIRALFA